MEKEQQINIIKRIVANYPRFLDKKGDFDDPKTKAKMWMSYLEKWDYEKTVKNLDDHIEASVFEPKIAEIKPTETFKDESWKEELKDIYGEY